MPRTAGASAYPRLIDFERFRAIADEVGAIFRATKVPTLLLGTGIGQPTVPTGASCR